MKDKKVIPFQVPNVGAQTLPVDVSQASRRVCSCGSEFFDKTFRVGVVSKLASGNRIGQDVTIEMPVYVCRSCGMELGKQA